MAPASPLKDAPGAPALEDTHANLKTHAERFISKAPEELKRLEELRCQIDGSPLGVRGGQSSELEPGAAPKLACIEEKFLTDNCMRVETLYGTEIRWKKNQSISDGIRIVRQEYGQAIRSWFLIERFVRLRVTKADEGAPNFYAGLQNAIVQSVVDARRRLEAEFYDLDVYFDVHADVVGKAEAVTATYSWPGLGKLARLAAAICSGGPAPVCKCAPNPAAEAPVLADRLAAISAKDAKWHYRLVSAIDMLITEYACLAHILGINFPRVLDPLTTHATDVPMMMY